MDENDQKMDELRAKSKTAQRIGVAVVVPVFLLLFAYGIMSYLYSHNGMYCRPNHWDESWAEWIVTLPLIGVFEYVWLKGTG